MALSKLVVRGARQHNLKNISLEIPRNTLTVITGFVRSGKSSLAFDTIYAEGQRRYVESLSAYARQFLDQMERPEVDVIEGLSPGDRHRAEDHHAVARARQWAPSRKSTITCAWSTPPSACRTAPIAGSPSPGNPASKSCRRFCKGSCASRDDRIMILAPIVRGRKGAYRKELEKLAQDGFVRVRIDGELLPLDQTSELDRAQESHHRGGG